MPETLSTSQTRIAYNIAGNGPVDVLFMHGWAGSGAYFDDVVQHLDLTSLRAITFDLRGHGNSAPALSGYGLDELAADAISVADAAGADRFVVVGFSMSAKFAQYVTSVHHDRVLGQILVAGCPVGELAMPAEMLADWYGRAGDPNQMIDLVRQYATAPIPEEVLQRFGRRAATVPLAALQGTMNAVTSTSFVVKTGAATVPTLIIGGQNDPLFTPELLREGVATPIADAELQLLDCGHEIPVERPAELARMIQTFTANTAQSRSQYVN